MKSKIKGLVGESSIVLHYNGEAITIQANTDRLLFEEFKELIKSNQEQVLIDKFLDVKARIEKYTNKNFYVTNQNLYLKGDDTPIPNELAKRLLELEAAKEDFMPLIRFWKKLKQNPSQASIEQAYGFIKHNSIPITDNGDIVTEKGVKQRVGAPVGELVDCRTGRVDNSIGMEVSMPRDKVDSNPNQTCSHGLHVGAPDYVRRHYGSNIIIQCVVNPADIVSVPTDYNNTKMRVCRYTVVGYAEKSVNKPVYTFEDFIKVPTPELKKEMKTLSSKTQEPNRGKDANVVSTKAKKQTLPKRLLNKWLKKFDKMKAKEVKKFVQDKYNITLTHSDKSKAAIVKAAAKIAANDEEIKKS